MQVIHTLCTILAIIDDNTKAIFQVQISCNLLADQHQMSKKLLIDTFSQRELSDRLTWNYKKVNGRLRRDIVKRNTLIVLIDEILQILRINKQIQLNFRQ